MADKKELILTTTSTKLSKDLKAYETSIRAGLASFTITGKALDAIDTDKLYKERGFNSFESYVNTMFDITRDYAYKQIRAFKVWYIIQAEYSPAQRPSNEGQCRPLTQLDDIMEVLPVWELVTKTGKRITAKLVKACLDQHLGIDPKEPKKNDPKDPIDPKVKPTEKDLPKLIAEIATLKNELSKQKPREINKLGLKIIQTGFTALIAQAADDDEKAELIKAKKSIIG